MVNGREVLRNKQCEMWGNEQTDGCLFFPTTHRKTRTIQEGAKQAYSRLYTENRAMMHATEKGCVDNDRERKNSTTSPVAPKRNSDMHAFRH